MPFFIFIFFISIKLQVSVNLNILVISYIIINYKMLINSINDILNICSLVLIAASLLELRQRKMKCFYKLEIYKIFITSQNVMLYNFCKR